MIYLSLFFEFLKVGLFSVGGGLATIPFLADMGERTGWFSAVELANMIAVSESTPGAMGINMATYVGYTVAGWPGTVIGPLGLVTPSIVVILIVAKFLQKYRNNRIVEGIFSGLRPASVGLIAYAGLQVAEITLLTGAAWVGFGGWASYINWKSLALAVLILICMQWKPVKRLHPIVMIAVSAVVGVIFQL